MTHVVAAVMKEEEDERHCPLSSAFHGRDLKGKKIP
jgi:hypothetical protein